ncbi:LysR family transcriptional regulator substrate-binding protein [Streptomyces rimosus]|uniref:LysR family transcriptional regulator substrate-binding protein n=1 Tax=Streptomyces rimosus TaxID=1927 RepID=UPI0037A763EE
MTGSEETPSFRLAYVPGVTPTKWVRIWNERLPGIPLALVPAPAAEAYDVLRDGGADAGFVRLPADRTYFSAIPLYTETTVVVVPKDHLFTAADEITVEELADEIVLHPLDDTLGWERPPGQPAFERPATTADAIELVAAGIGLLVVPQSLARLYHRKDLKYRTLTDAPQSQVALAWPEERTTDQVEDFIGIVRGRTVNSTRGRTRSETKDRPKGLQATKDGARQKTAGGKPRAGQGARGTRGGSGSGKSAKPDRRGKPRRRS